MYLLDLLFPKRCLGCGRVGKYICTQCTHTISSPEHGMCPMCEKPAIDGYTHPRCRTKYAMDGLTSFFVYKGVIREGIKQIKYRGVFDIARELVERVPQRACGDISGIMRERGEGVLVPIPLHPVREKERGFNQTVRIGAVLAKKLQLSMSAQILRRTRQTVPQVQMRDREKRMANMKDVFALQSTSTSPPGGLPSTVILFDDVFTTGATMRAATSILKRAGVKFVWGVTIAR